MLLCTSALQPPRNEKLNLFIRTNYRSQHRFKVLNCLERHSTISPKHHPSAPSLKSRTPRTVQCAHGQAERIQDEMPNVHAPEGNRGPGENVQDLRPRKIEELQGYQQDILSRALAFEATQHRTVYLEDNEMTILTPHPSHSMLALTLDHAIFGALTLTTMSAAWTRLLNNP